MGPGTAIVITDATIVKDLMDKRSQTTIDRPPNHKVELVTGGMHIAFARYSKVKFLSHLQFKLTPSQLKIGVLSDGSRKRC